MFLVILVYMLFASGFTIGKAVLYYLDPIFFIGFRMILAGTILLSYLYFRNRSQLRLQKRDLWLFMQVAIFHVYFAYVTEFWALQYLTSFKTAFIYNLTPFFSALLAYFFFSEKMNLRKWLGMFIGFFGFLIILADGGSPGEASKHAFGFFSWPEIALLVSVVSAVYGWVLLKKLNREKNYSIVMVNGAGMLTGGFLALITSFFVEGVPKLKLASSSPGFDILTCFSYAILLIIITNVIACNLYGYLLKKYSFTFLSFVGFICPLFAALYGNIFLAERPTIYFFISVAIVAVGLYLFYKEELKHISINDTKNS